MTGTDLIKMIIDAIIKALANLLIFSIAYQIFHHDFNAAWVIGQ